MRPRLALFSNIFPRLVDEVSLMDEHSFFLLLPFYSFCRAEIYSFQSTKYFFFRGWFSFWESEEGPKKNQMKYLVFMVWDNEFISAAAIETGERLLNTRISYCCAAIINIFLKKGKRERETRFLGRILSDWSLCYLAGGTREPTTTTIAIS